MRNRITTATLTGVAAALLASSAMAQKSKDTLRLPHHVQLQTVDFYVTPGPWDGVFSPALYQELINYNPDTGKFVPGIAKSWKKTSPTEYEFELRDDLAWSDGEKIDADDVVYIINYLVDPKVRLRLKANWRMFKGAEKLGPHKVKISTKRPTPVALMRLAERTFIYPEHIHAPLGPREKRLFAQKGVSYGAYRLAKFERASNHLVLVKNPGFKGTETRQSAQIGTIESKLMPDFGTQIAQLTAGNIDAIRGLPIDRVEAALKTGRFAASFSEGIGFQYMAVYGQSGENVPALKDPRVRLALAKAIDRKSLQKVVSGDRKLSNPPDAICSASQVGCHFTKMTPAYDPAGAKKLLAEAGYPNGFDVTITTFRGALSDQAAVVGGMLRKVGIRAKIQGVPIPVARKLAKNRKLELIYYAWGGGSIYDVSAAMARFFMRPEFEDKKLAGMARKTNGLLNLDARKNAVAAAIDYSVDKGYLYMMTRGVTTFLHTKEVGTKAPATRPTTIGQDFVWK